MNTEAVNSLLKNDFFTQLSHSPINFEENNNEIGNKAKLARENNLKYYQDPTTLATENILECCNICGEYPLTYFSPIIPFLYSLKTENQSFSLSEGIEIKHCYEMC